MKPPPESTAAYLALQKAWDELDLDGLDRAVDDVRRLSKNLLNLATLLGVRFRRADFEKQAALLDAASTRYAEQAAAFTRTRLPAWMAEVGSFAARTHADNLHERETQLARESDELSAKRAQLAAEAAEALPVEPK